MSESSGHHHTDYGLHIGPTDSSENRSSSPQSSSAQDQFIDGHPTASLNRQLPGFVRTFSQSSSRHGQFEAETTPNVAYIARTSSQHSHSNGHQRTNVAQAAPSEEGHNTVGKALSLVQKTCGPKPDIKEQGSSAHKALKDVYPSNQTNREESPSVQEQTMARVLTSASVSVYPVQPIDERYENLLFDANKIDDDLFSSEFDDRIADLPSSLGSMSGPTIANLAIDEVEERDNERTIEDRYKSIKLQSKPLGHEVHADYFGDSIEGEEALFPPAPSRISYPSRSSTPEYRAFGATRLFPTNPDPPSGNTTDENLPTQVSSSAAFHRHPSYRFKEPIRPSRTAYPSPLRHQSLGRTATTRTTRTQVDKPVHVWDSRRKHWLPIVPWNKLRERPAHGEATQGDNNFFSNLMNSVAPSHWAFHGIQAAVWLALVIYFFWRVSQVKDAVAFDCYELKAQLVHLFGNSTLCGLNGIPTSSAFGVAEHEVPKDIAIPEEFHGVLKEHCILRPVHSAIVLASSFEVWFLAMMVACGITFLLESLALAQLRQWLVKSGPTGHVTLAVRLGVRSAAVGIACILIAGPAWAMKGGWSL